MAQDNRRGAFLMVFVIAFILQVIFIYADTRDTPALAVVEFSRMYYQLDPAMSARLCSDLAQNEEKNVVATYIQNTASQARELGYDVNYMKSTLFNIKTYILKSNGDSAEIRITADMKKGIHPLFAYVGRLFSLGKTTPLDQTVNVVKEGGKWKVCEGFFSLSES